MSRQFHTLTLLLWILSTPLVRADIPGDADGDGDVDFDDAALYTLCQFGPAIPSVGVCQSLFDYDADTDVDVLDYAALQRCTSGANQPAFPDCAPHIVFIDAGCLEIIGTAADSVLALRLRAGLPAILDIDVGNDGNAEFSFDRALFACIHVDARGGNDTVIIDESNGVFTTAEATTVFGGTGNDTLFGGSGAETFIGGDGNDTAFMGDGADRFVWNPGDDTDIVEGGPGADIVVVNGGDGGEQFTVTANGTRVRFDRISPAPFFLDINACEQLTLHCNGGDDSLACTGNLSALIQITADGGPGEDTLLGSNGPDTLIGGDDDDFIDGNQGNDFAFLGAGNDTFQWDPGDGSDTVEGQAGVDTLVFNGSAAAEIFDFSANGSRLRFTRNVGNIVMDVAGVEQFDLRALGGIDSAVVNDLTGVGLGQINIDLAGTIGGSLGDASTDGVTVMGTQGVDTVTLSTGVNGTFLTGLAVVVNVVHAEPTIDQLAVNLLGGSDVARAVGLTSNWTVEGELGADTVEVEGGNADEQFTVTANGTRVRFDRISPAPFFLDINACEQLTLHCNGGDDSLACTGNLSALIQITADGGPGEDTLLGSNGPDTLIGGDDDDFIDGNQGNDFAFLGAGNDTFQWDPGDGSDTVEGQAGVDTLVFNGSAAAEIFDFSANGSRLRFTRNVGNIVMDVAGVEQFDLRALGGIDSAVVNDLTGVGLGQINIDLAGTIGGSLGDASTDTITVNGTPLPDTILINAVAGAVEVTGLPATVRIAHSEAANDTLTVNGLAGSDTITPGPGVTSLIMLVVNP